MIENHELKKKISEFENLKKELNNQARDFFAAKTIVTHEINILANAAKDQLDAFVQFREETEKKLDKLESINHENDSVHSVDIAQRVHVKLSPPNFSGNEYDRPMQFLTDLKKYISSTNVTPACLGAVLQQSLTKKANRWFYTVEHRIKSFDEF